MQAYRWFRQTKTQRHASGLREGAPSVPVAAGLSVRPRTEADRILTALRRDLETNGEFSGGS